MSTASTEDSPGKSGSVMAFLISIAIVSGMAVIAGWLLSGSIKGSADTAKQQVEEKNAKAESHGQNVDEQKTGHSKQTVVRLDPIIVGLGAKKEVWIRIEVAIVAMNEAHLDEPVMKVRIENDIAAYLQNVTLKQISGPSGYLHLKEDLLDRARLTTEGKVIELMILTLVTE